MTSGDWTRRVAPRQGRAATRPWLRTLAGAAGGVLAGVGVAAADAALGLTLPSTVEQSQSLLGALVAAAVTLAVFALWMRSIVVSLSSSQVSARIASAHLDDAFQWQLLARMSAIITFVATVHLGLPDAGPGAPVLSVALALVAVISGLFLVLLSLHRGVHELAPPQVISELAEAVRDALRHDGSPDDPWPEDEPLIPSSIGARVISESCGWVVDVAYEDLLRALPPRAHAALHADIGTFVGVADLLLECDTPLDDARREAIRGAISIGSNRSASTDFSFALQQLRDLAQQALRGNRQDTSTAHEALLHLRSLLAEIVRSRQHTGHSLGSDERALTSVGRPRAAHHVKDTFEILVVAARSDPISRRHVRAALDHTIAALTDEPGIAEPAPVLHYLHGLRDELAMADRSDSLAGQSVAT